MSNQLAKTAKNILFDFANSFISGTTTRLSPKSTKTETETYEKKRKIANIDSFGFKFQKISKIC